LLRTERLVLRKPTPADVEAPPAFLVDPEVMQWLGGVEDPHVVVRQWLAGWETFPAGKFIVETRAGAVIGRVGLNFFDPQTWARSAAADAQPELTWGLAREHWGHGYATEAAIAVRDWFGAARYVSLIAPGNIRSQAVARRLGAVPGETIADFEESGPHVVWEHPPPAAPGSARRARPII
jgi:RimJ/RimL family protein N-acetyltransferase